MGHSTGFKGPTADALSPVPGLQRDEDHQAQTALGRLALPERVGYKLLVYLRCLLSGQAFPPG